MAPDPSTRVIEDRATRTWLGADGVVRAWIRPHTDFALEDSVAALAATRVLAPSLPVSVLVDCSGVRSASRAARTFWENEDARGSIDAMALVVGSPVSRMIATFFLRLVRPDFRVRLFSSERDAVSWLLEAA